MDSVTTAEETRSRAALLAVTERAYRANELALKWGRHWHNLVKSRRPLKHKLILHGKENRDIVITSAHAFKSNLVETPKFYENFKSLKNSRPAPRIPNFLVQKHF